MKIRINSLCFLGIVSLILSFVDVDAMAATKKCPAGFFCTSNGTYVPTSSSGDIQAYQMGPADLVTEGWGNWIEEGLCNRRTGSSSDTICAYFSEDYDEVWVSTWFGFYMVKNGKITYHASGGSTAKGAFPCPGTHPSSAQGSSSVFECYKVMPNGKKEYYQAPTNTQPTYSGTCDINDIRGLVNNLQSALDQANKAAQNLQNALNKVNAKPKSSNSAGVDMDKKKKMIKVGVSDTKGNAK